MPLAPWKSKYSWPTQQGSKLEFADYAPRYNLLILLPPYSKCFQRSGIKPRQAKMASVLLMLWIAQIAGYMRSTWVKTERIVPSA